MDHHENSRAEIGNLLRRARYETCEVESGLKALDAARERRPRLAVIEVSLPDLSGYQVCRELKEECGDDLPIILVSHNRTESYDRVAGLLIGADDYVVKPFAPDELLARVRTLVRRFRPPPSTAPTSHLTGRELEILRLLADGLGQADIAVRLVISEKTVSTHIEHVLTKLGVRSRAQAVAAAYRDGLVVPTG